MVCDKAVPVENHGSPGSQLSEGCSVSSFSVSALCKLKSILGEAAQIYCTRLCLAQQDTDLGWSFLARQ